MINELGTLFYQNLPVEKRRAVVTHVVQRYKHASTEVRAQFERAVQATVHISGFRDLWRAPKQKLCETLTERSITSQPLAEATLLVWLETQSTLRSAVEAFTEQEATNVFVLENSETQTSEIASDLLHATFTFSVVPAFAEQHPEISSANALLMSLCLSENDQFVMEDGEIAMSRSRVKQHHDEMQGQSNKQGVDMPWSRWLEELKMLPADAPAWENAEAFVDELRALMQEKRSQAETLDQLKHAILTLQQATSEPLDFFGFAEVGHWDGMRCPTDRVREVIQQVNSLQEKLTAYWELSRQPAASLVEKRRAEAKLEKQEAEIINLHDMLSHTLAAAAPAPDPLDGPAHNAEEVDEGEARDELHPANETTEVEGLIDEGLIDNDYLAELVDVAPDNEELPATPSNPTVAVTAEACDTKAVVTEEIVAEVVAGNQEVDIAPGDTIDSAEAERIEDDDAWVEPTLVIENQLLSVQQVAEPVQEGGDHADAALEVAVQTPLENTPSLEYSVVTLTGEEAEDWDAFLWSLISTDDLTGAYWVARSLNARGETPAVPERLLEAVQGARWLTTDATLFANDLLAIVHEYEPDSTCAEHTLLGIAAALCPALLAPMTEVQSWLDVSPSSAALSNLLVPIREFARLGIALHPADILVAAGAKSLEEQLADAASHTKRWLQSPEKGFKLLRATEVWYALIGAEGELKRMLAPVCEDLRDEASTVRSTLEHWRDAVNADNMIDEIDVELHGRKRIGIEAAPRRQLHRAIEEACAMAARWCDLVDQSRQAEGRNNWLLERAATLRNNVGAALSTVDALLIEWRASSQPRPRQAATICLQRALVLLRSILALPPTQQAEGPELQRGWETWYLSDRMLLADALNRRLLWLPEVELTDDGAPREEALPMVAPLLYQSYLQDRSLSQAFSIWLHNEDYRFVEKLQEAVEDQELAARQCVEMRLASQARLRNDLKQAEEKIEQAVTDGILTEDERTEYLWEIEPINPDRVLNFREQFQRIESLHAKLLEERQKRLMDLHQDWENLQVSLRIATWEKDRREQVFGMVQSGLDRGDTRVVEELLAQLRQMVDTGDLAGDTWFSNRPIAHLNEVFFTLLPSIKLWLTTESLEAIADHIHKGSTRAGINFKPILKVRRGEAVQAIRAWRKLKQQDGNAPHASSEVTALLTYIGFVMDGDSPVERRQSGKDWLYLQVRMSDGGLARPIPQYGSNAKGHYHVVCFWERPGTSTVAARLKDLRLGALDVLIFYLGGLTVQQRRDLTHTSRDFNQGMALVDETLLVYLAQEQDNRLAAFLRSALPYTKLSPYVPTGYVPEEIFYGRREMAAQLMRFPGSCIVYGGRQLGKSALLHHVKREFHNPSLEQYAWVEDIKLVGDRTGIPDRDNIWLRIRDGLRGCNLITTRMNSMKPTQIAEYVRQVLAEKANRRILVLFDEADNFLDADAKDNFGVVDQLRALMAETQRFKIVFAGLHNVQRFQGIPNQPLAHFGPPLCVGPLDPNAAIALVREPLDVLGFRPADDATVLRILSYTNYHPSLIQFFCQELVQRHHERATVSKLPYVIQQNDVEAVYRKLRERINERFDWTLRLDTRYQAIAWVLVVDQMERRDSYAQAYDKGDILKMVQQAWPQGFNNVEMDKLQGLLNEMVGLGVLVHTASGHYRLRSPNLVRLMGTEQDITNRLKELRTKDAPVGFEADNYHTPLDDKARRYSPLTYQQERSLNHPKFGIGLIFGCEAMGIRELPKAVESFERQKLAERTVACVAVPFTIDKPGDLTDWLDKQLAEQADCERIFVYQRFIDDLHGRLAEMVEAGLEFCSRQRTQRRWMRIIFLFHPRAAWSWLRLPYERRKALEDSSDTVTYGRLWNEPDIRQRLTQNGKVDTEDACRKILECTGGWPYLLDALFDRAERDDDLRPPAKEMAKELADPTSPLRQEFTKTMAVDQDSMSRRVFDFVHSMDTGNEGVPDEWITPENLGGSPPVTQADCDAAAEFLQRMGCFVRDGERLRIAPILRQIFPQP